MGFSGCQRAKGTKACWTYVTHLVLSDAGGTQDKARQEQAQIIKEVLANSNQVSIPGYTGLDLSSLRKLTQPFETGSQLLHLLNTTYQFVSWEGANPLPTCWLCLPLHRDVYIATPVLDKWTLENATTEDPTPNRTVLRPVAFEVKIP